MALVPLMYIWGAGWVACLLNVILELLMPQLQCHVQIGDHSGYAGWGCYGLAPDQASRMPGDVPLLHEDQRVCGVACLHTLLVRHDCKEGLKLSEQESCMSCDLHAQF